MLDAMFETYNTPRQEIMAITSIQAVRLHKAPTEDRRETQNGSATQGSSGQGLTMGQAEKVLKTLVEEGWFERSRKGFYSLSPRALMELRGWLMETYNDLDDEEEDDDRVLRVKLCFACKEIITQVSKHTVEGICILIYTRAKGVRRGVALVGYMIYVHRTSSEYRKQSNVPYVRLNGLGTTLSARGQSQPRRNTCKAKDEVAVSKTRNGMLVPPLKNRSMMRKKMKKKNRVEKERFLGMDKVYYGGASRRQSPPADGVESELELEIFLWSPGAL